MDNKHTPDFTPWTGGARPVDAETEVVVQIRNGAVDVGLAREFNWAHRLDGTEEQDDIVAYRIGRRPTPLSSSPEPSREPMNVPGYEALADVLHRAYIQAALGKGRERHAHGEPFHEQVMQDGARRFGVGALLFQAYKKSEESQRLPLERGVAELLGAINYLAGAVIRRERDGG